MRILQATDGAHQLQLDIEWQTGRNTVGINLVGRQPFRLKENLVRFLVGETMNLVFHGRTVARTDTLDDTGIHRRTIQTAANDVMRTLIGFRNPTGNLCWMLRRIAEEGKYRHRIIARLFLHDGIVNGTAVDAWRRPGFEASGRQTNLAQSGSQRNRWRITSATSLIISEPHVNQPTEKSPRCQHHRLRLKTQPQLRNHTSGTIALQNDVIHRLLKQPKIGLILKTMTYGSLVQDAVGLSARSAHGRPLA